MKMKLRLLNQYEEITYEALSRVCQVNGAHVFPKVRLADVFPLENSGIQNAHFTYALRSHFDFLVTDSDYQPQFSVEFDGPLHKSSGIQRRRDVLKNELCEYFDHGLLRINSKYLTPSYRGLDLLTYFVDAWFMEKAFSEAQHDGIVPYDEPFDITYVYSTGQSGLRKWPYWLSLDIQVALEKLHSAGRIGQMAPSYYVGIDDQGNYHCLSWLVMSPKNVLAVTTGMRAQRFQSVCEDDLVSMLAMYDLYPKIQRALEGASSGLIDRDSFFDQRLPIFQTKFRMVSSATFGAA